MIIKEPGRFASLQTNGDHPNDSIIENGQYTEKSPENLKKFAVTQTSVKKAISYLSCEKL